MKEETDEEEHYSLASKPTERKRKFAKQSEVADSIPLNTHVSMFIRSLRVLLLPTETEVPHSGSYLVFSRTKVRDYEASAKHPIKSVKNRSEAKFEHETPVIIAGHRIHRLMIPIAAVILVLVVGALRAIF